MSISVLVWAHNCYRHAESSHELQPCDAIKPAHGQQSQQVNSRQRWSAKRWYIFCCLSTKLRSNSFIRGCKTNKSFKLWAPTYIHTSSYKSYKFIICESSMCTNCTLPSWKVDSWCMCTHFWKAGATFVMVPKHASCSSILECRANCSFELMFPKHVNCCTNAVYMVWPHVHNISYLSDFVHVTVGKIIFQASNTLEVSGGTQQCGKSALWRAGNAPFASALLQ